MGKKRWLLDEDFPEDTLVCDLMMEQAVPACIACLYELGVLQAISEGPQKVETLSHELELNAGALEATLLVTESRGITSRSEKGITLSKLGRTYFLSGSNFNRAFQFIGPNSKDFWYQKIEETLKSGLSPVGHGGKSYTDHWEGGDISPEAARRFTGMMHTNILAPAVAVAKSRVFDPYNHIVDAGGGSGALLIALAQFYGSKKSLTLFDLPNVCLEARRIMDCYEGTGLIQSFPGSFFESKWPSNMSVLFFCNILHDWPNNKASEILNNAHKYSEDSTDLFIYECLLDESKTGPLHTVVFNLLMYANHGSQQFTRGELDKLCSQSGWIHGEKLFEFGYYSLLRYTKN